MIKPARRFALLAASLLLGGSTGVLESGKPARQVYLLQPPQAAAAQAQGPALILNVTAVPGLDTDRVLVLGRDARLNPVANAHWADNLPEVLTSLTRRTLSEAGRFERVAVGAIARPDEWLLEIELQAFYGIQGSSGTTERVLLRLEAALRCGERREKILLDEDTAASESSIARLVAAHQQVLDEALRALPGRVVEVCSA